VRPRNHSAQVKGGKIRQNPRPVFGLGDSHAMGEIYGILGYSGNLWKSTGDVVEFPCPWDFEMLMG